MGDGLGDGVSLKASGASSFGIDTDINDGAEDEEASSIWGKKSMEGDMLCDVTRKRQRCRSEAAD